MLKLFLTIMIAVSAWAFGPGGAALAVDRLLALDGTETEGEIRAIDARGQVLGAAGPLAADLEALRAIERPAVAIATRKDGVRLHLVGGGTLVADSVTLGDQHCTLDWTYGKGLRLPTEAVLALRFPGNLPDKQLAAGADPFERALGAARGAKLPGAAKIDPPAGAAAPGAAESQDQFFLLGEGELQTLAGVFEALTADELSFSWQGTTRRVPRDKVYALVLAPLGGQAQAPSGCVVSLRDGSSPAGRVLKLEGGRLTLETAAGVKLELPWEHVARLEVTNDRLVYLSDLEPRSAVEEPLVTFGFPWRRDRSVLSTPLTLGKKIYKKGLGVHSRSALSFACEGYAQLAATVGIDAAAQGKGDCEFVVEADGVSLFKQRLRGGDAPVDVRVDLAGRKEVTLIVEPGEDLDLADYADWCDARVIRAPRK